MFEREQVLSLLMVSALELWARTLDGGRSASTEAMYHVLSNPQPGDLVLEISSRQEDNWSRFGRLIKVVKEPIDDWSEEDEEINGPRPSETYWYIEDVDGEVHRWYNCVFIRVLDLRIDPIQEAKSRGLVTSPLAAKLQAIHERVEIYTRKEAHKQ